jgi:cytochrome c oxidase assembly protein subunit 15
MPLTMFQKLALGALVSLLMLIFVGAIVRVSGAGMGCPDWPMCWGRLIPPTAVEQVDFDRLPIERFQRKAARMGRDPSTITADSLRAEFNPRHVWTEFTNRLFSLPIGFFSLALCIAGFWQIRRRPLVAVVAALSLIVVLLNAWMGARVVYSGLRPGVLTTHLALAMALTGMLVYCAWRGCGVPWWIRMAAPVRRQARVVVVLLLLVVVAEGIIGAQVREMTDLLAKFHDNAPRETWIGELENSWKYLAHRTLSWAVLGLAGWAWWLSWRFRDGGAGAPENAAFGIVLAQMVLGLVMSQIHIYEWVQVAHVGLAAVLLSLLWLWMFGLLGVRRSLDSH